MPHSSAPATENRAVTGEARQPRRGFVAAALAALTAVTLLVGEGAARAVEWTGIAPAGLGIASRAAWLDDQTRQIDDLQRGDERRILRPDSLLGWIYGPGHEGDSVTVNVQGHRGPDTVATRPAASRRRLAVWGDSFAFCNEVADEACWTARLDRSVDDLDVLNFGVGGFGIDQALLRMSRDGARFGPTTHLLVFTDDDIRRATNVYRRFVSDAELPLAKPRFREAGDSLHLEPSPTADPAWYALVRAAPARVFALGARDQHYASSRFGTPLQDWSAAWRLGGALVRHAWRQYGDPDRFFLANGTLNPQAEAFRLHIALGRRFLASARRDTPCAAVLVLPARWSVEAVRAGRPAPLGPLLSGWRAAGIPVLDATPALAAGGVGDDVSSMFAAGGHYSAAGNARVAAWLESQARSGEPSLSCRAASPPTPATAEPTARPAGPRRPT